jgi:GR25 family glycosyltransferase involved in LPS biosynthesis
MQRLPDRFSHTFIINLPERVDRLDGVAREFEEIGFWIHREGGPITVFPGLKFQDADSFPSAGFRGSFSSHLAVIERAKEMGLQNVLVCEDDLKFTNVPGEVVGEVIKAIPDKWDMIFFGYLYPGEDEGPVGVQPYSGRTMGTHCYAVNGSFFDTLIEYMRGCRERPAGHPDGGRMGCDGTMNHLRIVMPEARIFLARPNLATQRSSMSSISPNTMDRAGLGTVLSFARRIRNRR